MHDSTELRTTSADLPLPSATDNAESPHTRARRAQESAAGLYPSTTIVFEYNRPPVEPTAESGLP